MRSQNQIKYLVEKVIIDEEKSKAIVSGWAFNQTEKKSVDFYLLGSSGKKINLKRELRIDVNSQYNLDNQTKIGFILEFNSEFIGEKKKIVLRSENTKKTIGIDLRHNFFYGSQETDAAKNHILNKMSKVIAYCQENGIKSTVFKIRYKLFTNTRKEYLRWIEQNEKYFPNEVEEEIADLSLKPKFSIVVPVYNPAKKYLVECLDSVLDQYYKNWELCIADDNSSEPHVAEILKEYEKLDSRIKVVFRKKNGHISEASNTALDIATGDYIGLLDNDDVLAPFALFEVAKLINENPDADLIYSDEDKIDGNGIRNMPFFKWDWSPETLLSTNYVSHFGVYKTELMKQIGGFRIGLEGAQDYDLVLRFSELTDKIFHIPKILYHWRMTETSTALAPETKGYAFEAGKKAIEEALSRRNQTGTVQHGKLPGIYDIYYDVKDELISIIIPTKDRVEELKKCIVSIISKSTFSNYEIIIVDNASEEEETKLFFKECNEKYPEFVKVVRDDRPFNFSQLNNFAATKHAKGTYFVFLNNDTEIISKDWLERMLGYAQQEKIGAVGGKLHYFDHSIQHAGVILGLGGVAAHGHLGFPSNDNGYFGKLVMDSNVGAVTGACLMMRKKVFDEIGGFDENFAVAYNDVDLCLKALEKGYRNVFVHHVELYHFESKSRGKEDTLEKDQRFQNEINLMKNKWGDLIFRDPYYNPNLTLINTDYSMRIREIE
ncbi:MAG: glycosyltransferase family 2 protein [Eubacteriaceae bacterium]